jgi:putative acetyltransferase
VNVRPERPADAPAIRRVLEAAFPGHLEADLVDALRAAGRLAISLVAEDGGRVVGHVAFSPVTLDDAPIAALGLAPLAVEPDHQRCGVGSALVRAGLDACRAAGVRLVVVLGEPAYYARFGFEPAARLGLRDEYHGGDAFRALALADEPAPAAGGLVRYAPEFALFTG